MEHILHILHIHIDGYGPGSNHASAGHDHVYHHHCINFDSADRCVYVLSNSSLRRIQHDDYNRVYECDFDPGYQHFNIKYYGTGSSRFYSRTEFAAKRRLRPSPVWRE